MDKKTLGLMAGMGPLTTVDFMTRIIGGTPGSQDQDHLHIIIDHNPTIANRQDALAGNGPDVGDDLTTMAQRLEAAGADFLAMSCNTAHAYQDVITDAINIPFISMIDATLDHLSAHFASCKVGVLATRGCLEANVYQSRFELAGLDWIAPEGAALDKLMNAIFEIKAGRTDGEVTQATISVINDLVFAGADVVLVACTELPLVLRAYEPPVPLVDATDLLVHRCIELATG